MSDRPPKPETIIIPVNDELWQHILNVADPEDLDDLVEFVTGCIRQQRGRYDYDSPWENYQ